MHVIRIVWMELRLFSKVRKILLVRQWKIRIVHIIHPFPKIPSQFYDHREQVCVHTKCQNVCTCSAMQLIPVKYVWLIISLKCLKSSFLRGFYQMRFNQSLSEWWRVSVCVCVCLSNVLKLWWKHQLHTFRKVGNKIPANNLFINSYVRKLVCALVSNINFPANTNNIYV